MSDTTTPVDGVALVCPPETMISLRALVQLGVLYSLQNLVCTKEGCTDCPDRMLDLYRSLATIGQDEGPFRFAWGKNAIELIVRDPVGIAMDAPSIGETITALEKKGLQVKHELTL